MASKVDSAAGRILHNSFWYGLEVALETIVFLGTSIAVARYLGPQKLGYYSYINFFVMVVNRTSGTGLASATRKYMSEFLALDQPGTARAVYYFAYRYQLFGALFITGLGIAGVMLFGDSPYRLMSSILILSIIPGVMSWVPAQANNAFEDVSKNTLSAFGYIISYAAVILLTLHFGWDLVGIASASLVGRTVEVFLRTAPLHRRLRLLPLDPLPPDIVKRIRSFCIQAIGIQLITSVVYDRSEMIFLRAFSSLEQIAFYSVSFGLVNNLLIVPRTFAGATGITLMVESSRDPSRVDSIVRNAFRFLLLVVLPVHLGAAAIAGRAIHFAYGARYTGAIPVIIVAAILSIPNAFAEIPDVLLRSADRQKQLIRWLAITGVINIALDAAFIPHFGAVGAAWGNGLSQAFGVVGFWWQARKFYVFNLPIKAMVRFTVAGLIMGAVASAVVRALPGVVGLTAAILASIPLYIVLVRVTRALEFSDRIRLAPLANRLPGPMRGAFLSVISFVTPAAT